VKKISVADRIAHLIWRIRRLGDPYAPSHTLSIRVSSMSLLAFLDDASFHGAHLKHFSRSKILKGFIVCFRLRLSR
jgi:hypothetical protein